jgi:hypothetical protein
MRSAAAQCELDAPRITGPITSLKILTIMGELFHKSDFGEDFNGTGIQKR